MESKYIPADGPAEVSDSKEHFDGGEMYRVTEDAYNLTEEGLDALEAEIVDALRSNDSVVPGTVCFAVPGYSRYGDFCRTMENQVFQEENYDFFEAMQEYESQSIFLYTVDVTLGKIAHCKRLVTAFPESVRDETGRTGIEIFDDRLSSENPEEKVDLDEILRFHNIDSLDKCLNVTTNFKTKRVDKELSGLFLLTSYKGVYELVQSLGLDHVITYQNQYAHKSLSSLGVEADKLCGRDFHLPNSHMPSGYDEGYTALILPRNEHNTRAFTQVDPDNELSPFIADLEVPLYIYNENTSGIDRLH